MNITHVMRIFPRRPIKSGLTLTQFISDPSLMQKKVALDIRFDSTQPTQVRKNKNMLSLAETVVDLIKFNQLLKL